jgi:putative SOS response-associated peptidase YedK
MCSRYEAPSHKQIIDAFGQEPDGPIQREIWPCYQGPFVRMRADDERDEDQPEFEVLAGQFGLLPFWAKDRKFGRRTYNARSETASTKPSFRDAWKKAQHCIIPAAAIYEPDWRTGKANPTRITRADGGLLGIAGLWERWQSPEGDVVHSYAMLTVNADDHEFMRNYHKPQDEKRMVVILPNGLHKDWLRATSDEAGDFMQQYPAGKLSVSPKPIPHPR